MRAAAAAAAAALAAGAGANTCVLEPRAARAAWSLAAPLPNASAPAAGLGPYTVKHETTKALPGMTKGGSSVADIIYPVGKSGEKFPFVSFAHGTTAGGPGLYTDYGQDLKTVASYGFIVVAVRTCPTIECFSQYSADQVATIKACRDDPSLHPQLANADFSRMSVYGHSMGAMATVAAVGGNTQHINPDDYNIVAAVSQHPCWDPSIHGTGIKKPILFTAGSKDTICEDGCAKKMFTDVPGGVPKAFLDVKGASHFEPTGGGTNSEDVAVALFLACWVRDEHCDKVYGSDGKQICKQLTNGGVASECDVVGGKSPVPPGPTPPVPPHPVPPAPAPVPPAPSPVPAACVAELSKDCAGDQGKDAACAACVVANVAALRAAGCAIKLGTHDDSWTWCHQG